MKYKTVIEIVSEADNPHDAADLAGDFLLGHLETGVHMKCVTRRADGALRKAAISLSVVAVVMGISHLYIAGAKVKTASCRDYRMPLYAMNPPLKTSLGSGEFSRSWEKEKDKAGIEFIKK